MNTLISCLIPKLQEHFSSDSFYLCAAPAAAVVFPAVHPDVGNLEIFDGGDELTVVLGKHMHSHFNCCEENLSEAQWSQKIVNELIVFLKEVFSNQIIFYGTFGVGGGCFSKNGVPPKDIHGKCYVWAGPVQLID